MPATNKETPAGQGEGFEITATPSKEQNVNDNQTTPTTFVDADHIGVVIPIDLVEIDGERISRAEWIAREQAKRDAFYLEHRDVIDAARPTWAEKAVIDAIADGEADLVYVRSYGSLELTRAAELVDGRIIYSGDTDRPNASIYGKTDDLSVTEIRELAASLLAAVPAMEAAEVTL